MVAKLHSADTEAQRSLLDELLEAWRYTRAGVIDEIDNLPDATFAQRPSGLQRSPLDLANHIVESGRLMAGELSRADGDFQRKSYLELLVEHGRPGDIATSKADALALLRTSFEEDQNALRRGGIELMQQPIRQFNGEYASRLAWMHHGIAHEEYHRGQVALYARLCGITPALTKQIYGE